MSLKVTYIGHATVLIEFNGITLLTDPVFSSHVLCFKRQKPLAVDPAKLPKPDGILLSHAHYDHLDLFSYKYIPSDVPIIIPEGMSKAIAPFVNNKVIELSTWSRFPLRAGCEICAIPAKHPGGRMILATRYRTCLGYVVTVGGENIYISGDTGYRDDFRDLARLFPLKFALLSAAVADSSWRQRRRHMSVKELIQCWEDLGKPHFMPTHWGTFNILDLSPPNIPEFLKRRAENYPELQSKMHIVKHGESWEAASSDAEVKPAPLSEVISLAARR